LLLAPEFRLLLLSPLYRIAAADFADDLEHLGNIKGLGKHCRCAKRLTLAFFKLAQPVTIAAAICGSRARMAKQPRTIHTG